jgi:hypothetical protein
VSVAELEAFHRRFLAPRMERALLALPAPPSAGAR